MSLVATAAGASYPLSCQTTTIDANLDERVECEPGKGDRAGSPGGECDDSDSPDIPRERRVLQ